MVPNKFLRAAKGDGDAVDLWLTGFIGLDVTFNDVRAALDWYSKEGKDITLNIYSHGGFLDDATAFYDWARTSGIKFQVIVWGTAMSAATVFAASAGKKNIQIAENASWMIHESYGGTDEMNEVGNAALARIYANLTGKGEKELRALMQATTTYGAKDAVKEGFAGSVMKTTARLAAMYDATPVEITDKTKDMKTIKASVPVKLTTMEAARAAFGDGTTVEVEVNVEDAVASAIAEKETEVANLTTELEALKADAATKATEAAEAAAAVEAATAAAVQAAKDELVKANAAEVAKLKADHDAAIEALKKPLAKGVTGDNQDQSEESQEQKDARSFAQSIVAKMTPIQKAAYEKALEEKKSK
jgi:ATP-dependent protease ClpP protease subunit